MAAPQIPQAEPQPMGPWGGHGPHSWATVTDSRVTGFRISHGDVIDSVQFQLQKNGGDPVWTSRFGGEGGLNHSEIHISNDEELIFVMGTYGSFRGNVVIGQLTFQTNKSTYGPYGVGGGTTFCMAHGTRDKIVGFYGTHGEYVDSIGVYYV